MEQKWYQSSTLFSFLFEIIITTRKIYYINEQTSLKNYILILFFLSIRIYSF